MNFTNTSTPKTWPFALNLLFALLIVWQMPGTIALRNALLGLFIVTGGLLLLQHRSGCGLLKLDGIRMQARLLGSLTVWMVIVILFWGAEPSLSWREFAGQWCIPLLCAATGAAMAYVAANTGKTEAVLTLVFVALFFQIIAHDLMGLWFWVTQGALPFRAAPFLHLPEIFQRDTTQVFQPGLMDKFSYVNNAFAALLLAEFVQRSLTRTRMLLLPNWLMYLALLAVLFCSYTLRTRNGNVGLLFLLVTAGVLVGTRLITPANRGRIVSVAVVFMVAVSSLGFWFFKSDPRWQTLVETIPVALDTQTHKAWLRQAPYPMLPSGKQADESNYERLAWAKEGVILVIENPQGTGYNRNAFGDGIDRKLDLGGAYRGGHSHSGVIDFAIANGIPGLLLWFAFLGALSVQGWRAFKGANVGVGLMLIFLVSGFFGRSIVDSTLRDHILQQFMLLAGLFSVFAGSALAPERRS